MLPNLTLSLNNLPVLCDNISYDTGFFYITK